MTSRYLLGRNGSELETRRGAKSDLRVTYTPRPDATPEGELTALASVFRYLLLDCRERRDDDVAADTAEEQRGEHAK
jgi:hypothetical protein